MEEILCTTHVRLESKLGRVVEGGNSLYYPWRKKKQAGQGSRGRKLSATTRGDKKSKLARVVDGGNQQLLPVVMKQ